MAKDEMIDPRRIQEISDRLEIQDLLTRYCTALDTRQFDLLDSVFTEEATLDYTSAGGIRGTLPEAKAWLRQALSLFSVTQHLVVNHTITIQGDRATSRCALFNPMGLPSPEGDKSMRMFFFGGYYNDTLLRTDGHWKICQRIEEHVWSHG